MLLLVDSHYDIAQVRSEFILFISKQLYERKINQVKTGLVLNFFFVFGQNFRYVGLTSVKRLDDAGMRKLRITIFILTLAAVAVEIPGWVCWKVHCDKTDIVYCDFPLKMITYHIVAFAFRW